jgi:hypothetical protein
MPSFIHKAIAEGITEITCNVAGIYFTYDRTLVTAPERKEPRRMPANFVPRDSARAFFGAQPPHRQKPAEVRIAAPVLCQKNDCRFISTAACEPTIKRNPNFRAYVGADDT